MVEGEGGQILLEQEDRVHWVKYGRVRREADPAAVLAEKFQPEGVEGPHPDEGRRFRRYASNALAHLLGGLVRVRERKNAPWVDTVVEQVKYAPY